MKKYFVEYSEGRDQLLISSNPVITMTMTFGPGLNGGHKTKKLALENAERVNKAAGKEIAKYAGAYNV